MRFARVHAALNQSMEVRRRRFGQIVPAKAIERNENDRRLEIRELVSLRQPVAAASISATMAARNGRRRMSVKFEGGRSLRHAHVAGRDHRPRVVFATYGCSRQPTEHGELSGVCQGVRDWSLKEAFGRPAERLVRREIRIKGLPGAPKKRSTSRSHGSGVESCQLCSPRARNSAQSSRSPMCATICAGVRVPAAMLNAGEGRWCVPAAPLPRDTRASRPCDAGTDGQEPCVEIIARVGVARACDARAHGATRRFWCRRFSWRGVAMEMTRHRVDPKSGGLAPYTISVVRRVLLAALIFTRRRPQRRRRPLIARSRIVAELDGIIHPVSAEYLTGVIDQS